MTSLGIHTWMKKSFGFPTKLLHISPLNNEVIVLIGMAASVPYIIPSSPWLSRIQAKHELSLWSSSEAETHRQNNTEFCSKFNNTAVIVRKKKSTTRIPQVNGDIFKGLLLTRKINLNAKKLCGLTDQCIFKKKLKSSK